MVICQVSLRHSGFKSIVPRATCTTDDNTVGTSLTLNSKVTLLELFTYSYIYLDFGPARFPDSCQAIHVTSSGDKLLYQLSLIKSGQKSAHHYCITHIINVVQLVFLHVQEKKA